MADGACEQCEVMVADRLYDEVAVLRGKAVEDAGYLAATSDPHRPEARRNVGHRDHRVEHRDVDVLAASRTVLLSECCEKPDRGEERRADVTESTRGPDPRRLALGAAVFVDPAHGLGDRGVRGPRRIGRVTKIPETGHRDVDQTRVERCEVVVTEAEALHDPRF